MNRIFIAVMLAFLAAGVSGCGGSSSSSTNKGVEDLSGRVVRGVLTMPDGKTPMPDATVYVPEDHSTRSVAPRAEGACVKPSESYSAYVCTQPDGSFELKVADSARKIKAFKGAFRAEIEIEHGDDLLEIKEPVVLSGESGDVRIAVVTGDFDAIENVLAKTGLGEVDDTGQLIPGTEKFDIFNGVGSGDGGDYVTYAYGADQSFEALFAQGGDGQPRIFDYDIVFINCGVDEWGVWPGDIAEILRNYVDSGGRLYVTDQSYDYIEHAFPEFIDFHGSDELAADQPEYEGEAEVGVVPFEPVPAAVDPLLVRFLEEVDCVADHAGNTSCLNEDGTIDVQGFLEDWAVMKDAHAGKKDKVRFWVKAEVSTYYDSEILRPLTASFNFGQGAVIYSSYHTVGGNDPGFFPQERILQYLVFE